MLPRRSAPDERLSERPTTDPARVLVTDTARTALMRDNYSHYSIGSNLFDRSDPGPSIIYKPLEYIALGRG
jgi:hypothetical protein